MLLAGLAYLVLAVFWTDSNRHAGLRLDGEKGEAARQGDGGENDDAPDRGDEDADGDSEIFAPFSVYNPAPDGLSQAFEYLRRRPQAASVQVLGRAISAKDLPANAVVLRVDQGWFQLRSLEELFEDLAEDLDASDDEADEADEADDETDEETDDSEEQTAAAGDDLEEPEDSEGSEKPEESEESDDVADTSPERWRVPGVLTERQVQWVRGGGRLVLAIEGEATGLLTRTTTVDTLHKVFPLWPGVEDLQPPVNRVFDGDVLRHTHGVFLWGDQPMISRWPMGRGDILLVAGPEMLQNAHLATADHLPLLEALVGQGRDVYFDETLHGTVHDTGTLFLLGRWRLIPGLILWLLAYGALWWRHGRAVGPAEDPYQERRSEAVDMVDSLAGLYTRALRRRDALELYHRAFVEHVGWRLGLQGDALDARAEELLEGPLGGLGLSVHRDISTGELHRQLQRINQAFRRIEHVDRF